MSVTTLTSFEKFLDNHTDEAWSLAVAKLLPSIHEVDKTATQVWFRFYPLALLRALQQSDDPEQLAARLLLQGNYYLRDQIDSSHTFLYGHRFWPEVKRAVRERADSFDERSTDLATEAREIAKAIAAETKVEESLLTGITAVALMTLQQVGIEAFQAAPGKVLIDERAARKSPEQVLRERARDDKQGLLGFLKTIDKEWTITFDENDPAAKYRMKNAADLAYGAAEDRSRDWRSVDPRRIEGPIPVECRSASCGTCWVGVLGGAEKLSDVARLEGKRIKEFGYIDTLEPKPLIRLACQAVVSGAVSIVIPPWNGVFGKYLREQKDSEAEAQDELSN
ncbi:MAG TPA: 2Fe-2S iron-sulfur cluster-binding protein [Pyrinomonadaceae bacterium]|nr:2Fe-2S iron-sulfur cluster-binding protein [Pyrinomonadaceae bacterium]